MKTRIASSLVITALIAAALPLAHAGAAELTVVGQDRRASASSFVLSGEDFEQEQFSKVAPGLDLFDVALLAQSVIPDADANATATQISMIAPGFLQAEGSISSNVDVFAENATAYASSQSNVAIRFTLDAPSPFSLVGFIEGHDNASMTVQVSRPFQTVAWHSASDEHLVVNQTGMLEADTYDLNVTCGASGSVSSVGSEQGSGSYDIILRLDHGTATPVVATQPVRAFPNPFRHSIRLTVPEDAREVRILDAGGRLVRSLPNAPSVLFDGRDDSGRPLGAGVYWVLPVGTPPSEALKIVRLR